MTTTYRWEIEPHPDDSQFDALITNSDEEARRAILRVAEAYLWDQNEGETRTVKVTLHPEIPNDKEEKTCPKPP